MAIMRVSLFVLLAAAVLVTASVNRESVQRGRLRDHEHPNLPLDHPLLARDASRITEQVHVTGQLAHGESSDP